MNPPVQTAETVCQPDSSNSRNEEEDSGDPVPEAMEGDESADDWEEPVVGSSEVKEEDERQAEEAQPSSAQELTATFQAKVITNIIIES